MRGLVLCLSAMLTMMMGLSASAQPAASSPDVSPASARAAAAPLAERAFGSVQRLEYDTYKGDAGVLLAEGDSWFDYPFQDVLKTLEGRYQYKVESVAHFGDTVEGMVYDDDQLAGLALQMKRLADRKLLPVAILLSGGGNDIAGLELAMLMNHAKSTLPQLNESVIAGVMDQRLRMSYLTWIEAVSILSQRYFSACSCLDPRV